MVCSASIGAQPNKKKKNTHPLLCPQGLGSSHFLILVLPLSSNAPSPSAHYRSPAGNYDHLQNSAMSIHRHTGIQIQHTEGERNTMHTHTVCYMSNTHTHTHTQTEHRIQRSQQQQQQQQLWPGGGCGTACRDRAVKTAAVWRANRRGPGARWQFTPMLFRLLLPPPPRLLLSQHLHLFIALLLLKCVQCESGGGVEKLGQVGLVGGAGRGGRGRGWRRGDAGWV